MAWNQANSKQIKQNSIDNTHIKAGAGIDESKIVIDWQARGAEVLAMKLLIDFVQVSGKTVASGLNNVAVTDVISAPVADADDKKGAVVQSGKNKVIIRDNVTGDPFVSADGNEVYGKLTHNGTDYIIAFFYRDNANVEQPFTFAEAATFDFQFPQRFDLGTIAETFASNEKFVDGASDVSARLDLEQIIKDVFGTGYELDHDGVANRTKSIVSEMTERTQGTVNTTVTASVVIDEVVDARGTFADLDTRLSDIDTKVGQNATDIGTIESEILAARGTFTTLDERFDDVETKLAQEVTDRGTAVQGVRDDLASAEAGKGASLIAIEDVTLVFTSTNVEGALLELANRLNDVEGITSSTEMTDARSSVLTGEHTSLDERLEAGETRFEAVKTEVEAARGTYENVNARIGDTETTVVDHEGRIGDAETTIGAHSTSITTLEGIAHQHFVEDKHILAGDVLINGSRYDLQAGTFVAGNKSLQVYVNGMLQMDTLHYTEITNAGGEGIAVNFSPETITEGMVLQFRWTK